MSDEITEGPGSAHLTISAIMPVFNGVGFIEQSIPPLVAMLEREEICELIVVDDGSSDESVALSRQLGARVIDSGGRLGPGGARNIAAEQARGDLLWFVDADVVVHADAAGHLIHAFDERGVVAVFGSYDDKPPARNFFSRYKNLVHHYYHQRAKEQASTFWSGCGAVRRDAFLAVNGFDTEKYKYPSIEDIELGHRLLAAGGALRLRREVQCTHLKVWRVGNLLHTEIFRRAIPWSRLIIQAGEGIPNDLNVGVTEQARATLAGLLLLCLAAVLAGFVAPVWLIPAALVMVAANWQITRFFVRGQGAVFALAALLFHQVYYLYSAAAFAFVYIEQMLQRMSGRTAAE